MFFDFSVMIIFNVDFSKYTVGYVIKVVLAVNVEEGLLLEGQLARSDHLCGFKCFAHRCCL